jgi:hypothetical protein
MHGGSPIPRQREDDRARSRARTVARRDTTAHPLQASTPSGPLRTARRLACRCDRALSALPPVDCYAWADAKDACRYTTECFARERNRPSVSLMLRSRERAMSAGDFGAPRVVDQSVQISQLEVAAVASTGRPLSGRVGPQSFRSCHRTGPYCSQSTHGTERMIFVTALLHPSRRRKEKVLDVAVGCLIAFGHLAPPATLV